MLDFNSDIYHFGLSRIPDRTIIANEESFGAHHYERIGVVIRQSRGCWLTDANGNRYLDCLAAYSAANPGHHHPKIVAALVEALTGNYGSVISNVVYTDPLSFSPRTLCRSRETHSATSHRTRRNARRHRASLRTVPVLCKAADMNLSSEWRSRVDAAPRGLLDSIP